MRYEWSPILLFWLPFIPLCFRWPPTQEGHTVQVASNRFQGNLERAQASFNPDSYLSRQNVMQAVEGLQYDLLHPLHWDGERDHAHDLMQN